MTPRVVAGGPAHRHDLPSAIDYEVGTVIVCDCGERFYRSGFGIEDRWRWTPWACPPIWRDLNPFPVFRIW